MAFFLYSIHVLTCLFLILVVLLQQGKGADLSVFGGGGTMTAFGARGAASLLHKLTVGGFILFTVTTLTIGAFQKQGSSVVTDIPAAEAMAEEAEPAAGEEAAAEPVSGALPEAEDPEILSPEAEEWEETGDEAPSEGSEPPTEDEGSGN